MIVAMTDLLDVVVVIMTTTTTTVVVIVFSVFIISVIIVYRLSYIWSFVSHCNHEFRRRLVSVLCMTFVQYSNKCLTFLEYSLNIIIIHRDIDRLTRIDKTLFQSSTVQSIYIQHRISTPPSTRTTSSGAAPPLRMHPHNANPAYSTCTSRLWIRLIYSSQNESRFSLLEWVILHTKLFYY